MSYKNIAIIRLSALGDIVHTIPAFVRLRQMYPKAHICWFAAPAGAKLLRNFDGIDEIVTLNLKKKGVRNKLTELKHTLALHRGRFDLVLDFQGLLKSAALARLLKGKHILGFDRPNVRESQARFFYDRRVPVFDETGHVVFKNLHLVESLEPTTSRETGKKPIHWESIPFPVKDLSPQEPGVREFLSRHGMKTGQYVVLNIGGGWETKLLGLEQYKTLIAGLKDKYPLVILWGNQVEREKAEILSRETGVPPADFFDFGQLILFIRGARLVISGDTLALHLSDLVKTPSVGYFGPTSPDRNGSLMKSSTSVYEKLPCGFCYKRKCGTIECIKQLNTEKIIHAVERLYEELR